MNENKIQINAQQVEESLANEWRDPVRLHGDACELVKKNQCERVSIAYIVADTLEVLCYFALVIGMLFFTLTALNLFLY